MKKICSLVLVVFLFSFFSEAFALDGVRSFGYGARPMGMGGAFTAIADDINATYWNPAGFAINPGVDVGISSNINNRNQNIGDNFGTVKINIEAEMDSPFTWIIGVGAASVLALQGAKYLSDQGVVKKNWGRDTNKIDRQDSTADIVKQKEEENKKQQQGQTPPPPSPLPPSPSPSPSPSPQQQTIIYNNTNVYNNPWPFLLFNPLYHANYNRPTYWDDRWDTGDTYSKEDFSPKSKAQFALGLTWMHDDNSLRDQNSDWYTVSLATGWEEKVALGGNINIYQLKIPSINQKGWGGGVDLGILLRPVKQVSVGLTVKEILTTDIRFQNGAKAAYKMAVNVGLAITPIQELTLAFDAQNLLEQNNADKAFNYGIEVRPFKGLALRCGLNNSINKTAGISIAIDKLIIEYCYLGGAFNQTQIVSANFKF